MRLCITGLILLLAAHVLPAQEKDAVIQKIIREGYENSHVMSLLDHLTNRIGPRLTSSDRLIQACEWAVETLQGWGLDAKMEKWGEYPVGFNRGSWSGRMVSPKEMSFTFGTDAWTAGTKGRVSGPAIMAPQNEDELAALKGGLGRRWIVEPGRRKLTRAWRRTLREEYAKAGVLGVIRSTRSALVPTKGFSRITWDKLPKLVGINMIKDHYAALVKEIETGEEVVLEFDIRNYFRKGPVPVYNVIADLKGSEKPEEYVIVGGHIDSWDGATGTTDNGTGTTSTMEAARILAAVGASPKRTIRFMLWSGEEQGILGSRAWCKAHQDELKNISAVFVHDMGTNYVAGIGVTEAQYADFEQVVAPVLDLNEDMPFKLRKVGGLTGFGSDHGSFLSMGVPAFFWRQKGRAQYVFGWHTQNDTFDLAIPEYQKHTSTVVATIAYGVANLPNRISREKMRSARGAIPSRRRLGVNLDQDTMTVSEVTKGSAAERAGLKKGDKLVSLDGVNLKDRFALRSALRGENTDKKLVVERKGKKVSLTLKWERGRRRRQ